MPPALVSQTAIRRAMAARIAGIMPTTPLVIKGAPLPDLGTAEEWIQFDLLSNMPFPSRARTVHNSYLAQVICFSRYAQRRKDGKVDRPYEMADIFSAALTNAEIDATESGNTSCLRLYEPKQIYLDLSSSGEFSKQIYLQATPMETHCMLLLFEAVQLDSLDS